MPYRIGAITPQKLVTGRTQFLMTMNAKWKPNVKIKGSNSPCEQLLLVKKYERYVIFFSYLLIY